MAEEEGDPVTWRVSKGRDFNKWWEPASWQESLDGE